MRRPFGSRTLLATCGGMAVLLAALAVVQYRWATRVAAADVQREREHLESAASLFANEFNGTVERALTFLQSEAWPAVQSGERLQGLPEFIGELYYVDFSEDRMPKARRLTSDGLFTSVPFPQWVPIRWCGALAIEQPPSLMAPVYDVATGAVAGARTEIMKSFRWRPDRCFVARIDQDYLARVIFPQLISRSFGQTAAGDYNFAVILSGQPRSPIYGSAVRADLRKVFFSISNLRPDPGGSAVGAGQSAVRVQHVETVLTHARGVASLYGPGVWELDVGHRGLALTVAFEHARKRNLMLSAAVESLLLAAIAFLAIGARRMQHLADQKLRFVAGVSHELRTPSSSISMLSRNLADGLVTGPEKVKQYGELIHQQSRRLNEMVEQALQYAALQAPAPVVVDQKLDLNDLIQKTVAERLDELTRAGFEVEIALSPDLPAVPGDPQLLRTALDNLLSNARKHAHDGHWIRVSADHSAPERCVRIRVEDRGTGIDPEDKIEIFEPFYRGRAAIEAQIPGSGLGLSLVSRAAELHRGAVTLESAPGCGCIFTVHLPV